MAISSLNFTGIAPSATAALSNDQKAFIAFGASASIFFSLARFSLLYINCFLRGLTSARFEMAVGSKLVFLLRVYLAPGGSMGGDFYFQEKLPGRPSPQTMGRGWSRCSGTKCENRFYWSCLSASAAGEKLPNSPWVSFP